MTIEYTGTLWALFGGDQYLADLTITDVSGTITTNNNGNISTAGVNLKDVRLSYLDSLSTPANILTLKIINEIQDVNNSYYNLQYKYFTRIRYFNTL